MLNWRVCLEGRLSSGGVWTGDGGRSFECFRADVGDTAVEGWERTVAPRSEAIDFWMAERAISRKLSSMETSDLSGFLGAEWGSFIVLSVVTVEAGSCRKAVVITSPKSFWRRSNDRFDEVTCSMVFLFEQERD